MAFSTQEVQSLTAGIDNALQTGRLNAWQAKFLSDIKIKLGKFGTRTRLSDKQIAKLHEVLVEQIPQNGQLRQSSRGPTRSYSPRSIYPWRSPAHRRRRSTYWLIRDLIGLAIVAGMIVLSFLHHDTFRQWRSFIVPGQHSATETKASAARPVSRDSFSVTDGDTIHFHGEAKGMRLIGLNAPEVFHPNCQAERELGDRATARLIQLLDHGGIEIQKVPCSCHTGTEGTMQCNYGRSCGIVTVNGMDVAQTLISEGLAVPFICGKFSCPPTPRPWC